MNLTAQEDKKGHLIRLFVLYVGGVVALGVAKIVLDFMIGERYVAEITWSVLQLNLVHHDSWWPMYEAMVARHQHVDIFQTVFFDRNIKFQYPPITILPFMVGTKLGMDGVMLGHVANLACFLSIIGIFVCLYYLCIEVIEKTFGAPPLSFREKAAILIISLLAVYSFYPIIGGQYIGQIQIIIDLFIAFGFLCWVKRWKFAAGAMIALAALIKPQFALFLIWALLRKEKQFAYGLMLVFVPAGLISLGIFGFKEHVDYLRVLSHIGKHGEVYWINQSINGLLNRLLVDVTSLTWTLKTFAPYNIIVHYGTLVSTVVLILFGLFFKAGGGTQESTEFRHTASVLDVSFMLLICTIASPVAWYHHYGVLLLPYFVLFLLAVNYAVETNGRRSQLLLLLLAVSYYFVANYLDFADSEEFANPPVNLLQSYNLFGGFIMLAAIPWLSTCLAQQPGREAGAHEYFSGYNR